MSKDRPLIDDIKQITAIHDQIIEIRTRRPTLIKELIEDILKFEIEPAKAKETSDGKKTSQGTLAVRRRRDATNEVKQFFMDNRNEPSKRSEIAEKTGLSEGSIQNVLMKSEDRYMKITAGSRRLRWKMRKEWYQACMEIENL